MSLALENVRILDFSRIWAGPHCTKLLADMGAEVIKVESTKIWDPHRTIVGSGNLPNGEPGKDPWNRSGWFNTLHMSKYGITLDLTTQKGQLIAKELVSISDVVIENFRSGLMDKIGLGYERLREEKPDLIMISMPAFGNTGPWREFIQYGVGQEQLGGISSMTGYHDDDAPIKSGVNFGDPIAGTHAAGAIMSALLYRRRNGEGLFIDFSQLESTVSVIGEHILDYQMNRRSPEKQGNRHPNYAPHGVYRCRAISPTDDVNHVQEEDWVTIAVTSDVEWENLCRVIGKPELAKDDRFINAVTRQGHIDELDEILSQWVIDFNSYEVMNQLQQANIPCTPVLSGEGIFNDPHFQHRELLELVDHESTGPYLLPGFAWKMSKTPNTLRWPSPRLGEHNYEIFGGLLGMSSDAIEDMEFQGITGNTPSL